MRALPDLHPDDITNRHEIAAQLRAIRQQNGLTLADLAGKLGCNKSNVSIMESTRSWRFRILARWAQELNHRPTLTIGGRQVSDDADELAGIYAAQTPTDAASRDRLLLRVTVNDLTRIRRHYMTASLVAERLGCGDTAVYWWESNPDGASLLAVQRYARAIDCRVTAGLVPIRAEVEAVAA